jgi:hypothetical protein
VELLSKPFNRFMNRIVVTSVCAVFALAAPLEAQTVQAVRVEGPSLRIDGQLTELVWRSAPAARGFLQREPDEGQPASDSTEVRVAYDDDALYVGARMYSRSPKDIVSIVTRRDRETAAETFYVSLDTYRDRRTAYSFGVTPASVRLDFYHPRDDMDDADSGYDVVWDGRAEIDSLGWTAEFRIPFTQLRFSRAEVQQWGVNFARFIPARNEQSFWLMVPKNQTGWSSRFGLLTGIRGVQPSRRIEAMPYVAADSRVRPVEDPANPFEHKTRNEARVGGDLKMGLGSNLTLDVTLNPDFGQVESDPANVNLSAFEVFFEERRPFFLEGSSLLNRRNLFYSRRIGAPPPGSSGADYAELKDNSTILGAAKLTGKLQSGLSIAGLTAVTQKEEVRTFDVGSHSFGRATIAPRSVYAAAAAEQEFGADRSTLSGMLTAVHRDLATGTPLADLVARDAVSALGEGRWRWADGKYDINYWTGYTLVRGDSAAILRQQRSSRRYWQRVDATHAHVDPSRTEIAGFHYGVGHSKMAGRHWLWDVDFTGESPGFEPNDMGSITNSDNRRVFTGLRWRETRPTRFLRNYDVGTGIERGWTFDWMERATEGTVFSNVTLPNFWRLYADYGRAMRGYSDRLTRGGPVMATPAAWGAGFEVQNASAARNPFGIEIGGERDENGGWEANLEIGFGYRPGPRWEIRFDPEWERARDTRQYLATVPGGRAVTYNNRYVFAAVDRSEISGSMRVNYTFTPNLTLETYAEPFVSSGRFHSIGELRAPRERDLIAYGSGGTSIARNTDGSYTVTDGASTFDLANEDFNVRSFRSNMVLRWEWRRGSTMYLVWQQNREADLLTGNARPGDLWSTLDAPGSNFLALKVTYWTGL